MVKKSFTVFEIIMVLIIIGVLSAVVLPKFVVSRHSAQIAKSRADIASIRMGILLSKSKNILKYGTNKFPEALDNSSIEIENEPLFNYDGILTYPIYSKDTNLNTYSWMKLESNKYRISLDMKDENINYVDFSYDSKKGIFDCEVEYPLCKTLTQ